MSKPRLRGQFGPLGIPTGPIWDSLFEEINPIPRASDGKMLRRFRVRGTDIIAVQDLMDQMFEIGPVSVEPIKMPSSKLFFLEYEPPKPGDPLPELSSDVRKTLEALHRRFPKE